MSSLICCLGFFLINSYSNCMCRELLVLLCLHLTCGFLFIPKLDTSNSLCLSGEKGVNHRERSIRQQLWITGQKNSKANSCCCVMGKRLGIGRVLDCLYNREALFSLSCELAYKHFPFLVAFYFSKGFWRQIVRLHPCLWFCPTERSCLCM